MFDDGIGFFAERHTYTGIGTNRTQKTSTAFVGVDFSHKFVDFLGCTMFFERNGGDFWIETALLRLHFFLFIRLCNTMFIELIFRR
jgi:hypothetical protein